MLAATLNALGVSGTNAFCRRLRRRKRNLHRLSSRPCWGCWRDSPSACVMPTLSFRTGQVNPRAAAARVILRINRHNYISLRDSLVLFAQQYSMQNCFLCMQPPSSSSSESPLPDERPCRPLTSLPPSAAAAGTPPPPLPSPIPLAKRFSALSRAAIFTGRCIVWFAVNKVPHLSSLALYRIC
jgi:hypothetical protein